MMRAVRLDRLQTRFLDPAVERRFRDDARGEELRLLAAVQGTWFLVVLLFVRNDLLLFEGPPLHALLAVRAAMLASLVAPLLLPRAGRGPAARDAAAFLSVVVVTAGGLYVNSTRPGSLSPTFATNVVGIVSCWVLLPMPARLQGLSAGLVTAGAVATLLLKPRALHAVEVTRMVIELLLANGIGAVTSVLFHRARRHRWLELAQRREAEAALRASGAANERLVVELREALGKVQALSGLLPMCFHCHRIRGDQGDWKRLEQYLEERTGAAVSHGLCPECLEKHYPGA